MAKEVFSFRLPSVLIEVLEERAKNQRRSRTQMLEIILEDAFQDKPKKSKPNPTKTKSKVFSVCKKSFEDKYNQMIGQIYYWTVKDASNLKQLIKKLEKSATDKGKLLSDQETADCIVWMMENSSEWTKANMSMPLLNSKYNEIINGRKENPRNQGPSIDKAKEAARRVVEQMQRNDASKHNDSHTG